MKKALTAALLCAVLVFCAVPASAQHYHGSDYLPGLIELRDDALVSAINEANRAEKINVCTVPPPSPADVQALIDALEAQLRDLIAALQVGKDCDSF